jgi:hypothetical protein
MVLYARWSEVRNLLLTGAFRNGPDTARVSKTAIVWHPLAGRSQHREENDRATLRRNPMWKAILVLFMTTSSQPMSTMVGQAPVPFVSRADCQEFIAVKRVEIDSTIDVVAKRAARDAELVHHELSCVEDTTGAPI